MRKNTISRIAPMAAKNAAFSHSQALALAPHGTAAGAGAVGDASAPSATTSSADPASRSLCIMATALRWLPVTADGEVLTGPPGNGNTSRIVALLRTQQ